MKKILVLGSGKIGSAAAYMLHQNKNYAITIADSFKNNAVLELEKMGVSVLIGNFSDDAFLQQAFQHQEYVLNACPFNLNVRLVDFALKNNVHYFDLSEDVASTNYIQQIAPKAKTVFIPQCGLAPGFVSIAAKHLCNYFDVLQDVKLRVGALTLNPNNALKYNLSWSTDGLLNEYAHPCDAISNHQMVKLPALEGLEHFTLDGVEYEAFNTSGGIGGLAHQLNGKVKNLDYKTVRYKGHCDLMRFLYDDLGFKNNRALLTEIFNKNIPTTKEDVILIYISVAGIKNNVLEQKTITYKIPHQIINGKHFTGIQLTTAGSVCAVIDLHINEKLPQKGFVMQEDIPYDEYAKSPFLKYYF